MSEMSSEKLKQKFKIVKISEISFIKKVKNSNDLNEFFLYFELIF